MKRNEIGEILFQSNAFVRRYLHDVKAEDFYLDPVNNKPWFKSGDTGIIDNDGWVFILGRTKDIIKRAGVPITPAALESCLNEYLGTTTSVVAVPDEVLGTEPFAVVGSLRGKSEEDIKGRIFELFGKDYALKGAVSLEALGLTQFPIGSTGKVSKRDLLDAVSQHLEQKTK